MTPAPTEATAARYLAERRLARRLLFPALAVMAVVIGFPLAWTVWESLHLHDLRMPWLGRPFVGLGNYRDAIADSRFRAAVAHTMFFTTVSVALEVAGGLLLAQMLHRASRGRAVIRVLVLLPW